MHVGWTKDKWRAFKQNSGAGPIHMLNLIRYRDHAQYEDRRIATGREAYAEYGRTSAPVFSRSGGKIVWRGRPEQVTVGPTDEHWDLAFIAEYPSAAAFVGMIHDPDYQAAVEHRTAGVLDSRLIRIAPLPVGDKFAD